MQIRGAAEGDLASIAELASRLQADPARMVVYLGTDAAGIEAELAGIDWCSISALAFEDDRLIGWLAGDADAELGRIFWLGPFVSDDGVDAGRWNEIASQLYAHCRGLLPAEMTEEELAIDARFERCDMWARGHGFAPGSESLVLTLESSVGAPSLAVRRVVDSDLELLGALHELLFPGTHATGRQLVEDGDDDHVRMVIEIDGEPAGYVAFEFQPDGAGYIDFLGVADKYRRRGLGAQLVRAAVDTLRRRGAAPVHLTVRQDNRAARDLYVSLGFREERVIRPLRRGFAFT